MANEVRFNIRLNVDGKERVVQLSGDVQQLVAELKRTDGTSGQVRDALRKMGDAMGTTRSEAENLNTALVNMNQLAEAFSTLASTVQQVQGVMADLTAAYAVQERAEVQLQTVMRQRMGATDAEVESIKALASAQQQLGVIGDEVQLMGAQQMATFLSERSSIEALLPAMNDLLAQQKGLNATEQDAVGIGNLLGKAMQGQTEVLRRVGVTFTAAQEQVMKFGTESQRAAMLAQVITDNVGHMNAELARTDIGRQKQLENTLGDIKEQFGRLVQPAKSALTLIASATTAASGMSRLVTSVRALHASMTVAAASSTALKWSIRGLEVATGIGAVLAALSVAVEVFGRKADSAADAADDLKGSTDGLTTAMQREESQLQASRAALEMNIARLKDWHGTKEEEKKVVDELNGTYGQTMGYFDSVAKWYNALTKNSETYCQQLVVEAKMRALANAVAAKEMELDELRENTKSRIGNGELSTERKKTAVLGVDSAGNTVLKGWRYEASEAEKAMEDLDEKLVEGNLELMKMKDEMRAVASGAQQIKMPVVGGRVRPGEGAGGKGSEPTQLAGLRGVESMQASYTFEVRAVGFEDVAAQLAEMDMVASEPMAKLQQLVELLARVEATGYTTGATFADLSSIMEGMAPEQTAAAVEMIANALEHAAKSADRQAKKVASAKESVAQLGSSLAGLGNALELPALNVAGTIAQAIANIALSYSLATTQSATMGPFAWIAFAAAGLAEMTAVICSIKQATAFAQGGVVSGPTYALIGEYAGASNNPEVVAPLSKLQDMIDPAGGAGLPDRIELVADGRQLRALLLREDNVYRRG